MGAPYVPVTPLTPLAPLHHIVTMPNIPQKAVRMEVAILENGKPVCNDVGVFPHPGSCRKFVTCSRRAVGSGIVGWVYECPSYLAFDPVGGRCNWANEFVCAEKR